MWKGKNSTKKYWQLYAIEMHTAVCCIAMEILQSISIVHGFKYIYWKGQFRSAPLPENTIKRKSVGSHSYALSVKTFF